MDDLRDIFLQPANACHRQYEALRAVCVDNLPLPQAASRFGYSPGSLRNLLTHLRQHPDRPFFLPPRRSKPDRPGDHPQAVRRRRVLQYRARNLSANQISALLARTDTPASVPTVSKILRDAGLPRLPRRSPAQILRSPAPLQAPAAASLNLAPRSFRTDFGGLFLFAPFLARIDLDALAARYQLPGSAALPAGCACRSLLALKLWSVRRHSNITPDTLDPGLALFAGLNAIPKRSSLAEYSCRIDPRTVPAFLDAWLAAARPLGLRGGSSFDLDFHTVPYHGDEAFLQAHCVSKRSRRQRGILAFLVRDSREDAFCHAEATVRKETQHDAPLRFAKAFRQRTGALPGELVFDSTLTTYATLARLHELGVGFLTRRRRSSKMIRKLLASDGWKRIRLASIARKHRRPDVLDQQVRLRGYPGTARQIAVANLGPHGPLLLLTNQTELQPATLVDRYARRMLIENAIAAAIDFFHMDALCSAVPLKVEADLQFTVMAGTLYRLLARKIGRGHERQRARQLFHRFVRSAATVRIHPDEVEVRLGRRAHNPLLIAAGFREDRPRLQWLGGKRLRLVIGLDDPEMSSAKS